MRIKRRNLRKTTFLEVRVKFPGDSFTANLFNDESLRLLWVIAGPRATKLPLDLSPVCKSLQTVDEIDYAFLGAIVTERNEDIWSVDLTINNFLTINNSAFKLTPELTSLPSTKS